MLPNLFAIVFAALYKVKDKKQSIKHVVVFEEAKSHGTGVLRQAFQRSLKITMREPILRGYDSHILNLSLQVRLGTSFIIML